MKRIRELLRGLGISRKISLAFILLNTLLILIVVIVVRAVYSNITFAQMEERTQYETRLHMQQLQRFTENINGCSNNLIIALNTGFPTQLERAGFPDSGDVEQSRELFDIMDRISLVYRDMSVMSVVFHNDVVFSTYSNGYTTLRRETHTGGGQYAALSAYDIGPEGAWRSDLAGVLGELAGELCYVKSLRSIASTRTVGYIVLSIDETKMHRLYGGAESGQQTALYICDTGGGKILSASVRDEVGAGVSRNAVLQEALEGPAAEPPRIISAGGQRYHVVVKPVNRGQWQLVSVTDIGAVLEQVNLMTVIILLVSGGLMVVFSLFIVLISRTISTPIRRLAQHMIDFRDEIPREIAESGSQDEIGILTSNFNIMIRTNNVLFDRLREDEQKRRHLELALTQTQVKPHFLYNTLDAAYCLVDLDVAGAKQMLKLLADHYRYVLNKGSEWITVAREIDALEKYLQIQTLRYNNMIRYEFAIPDELLPMQLPKLTLQPLVENAIYHGIKPTGRPGLIRVTGSMEDNRVYLRVQDDGAGMTAEEFSHVMQGEAGASDSDSFGLRSVADRIRLFYGERSSLTLESGAAAGTALLITIDLRLEDDDV